jgi:hypothetical protein
MKPLWTLVLAAPVLFWSFGAQACDCHCHVHHHYGSAAVGPTGVKSGPPIVIPGIKPVGIAPGWSTGPRGSGWWHQRYGGLIDINLGPPQPVQPAWGPRPWGPRPWGPRPWNPWHHWGYRYGGSWGGGVSALNPGWDSGYNW